MNFLKSVFAKTTKNEKDLMCLGIEHMEPRVMMSGSAQDINDQMFESREVQVGKAIQASIDNDRVTDAGDVDMFQFNVASGQSVEFKSTQVGTGRAAYLRSARSTIILFNENGTRLRTVNANAQKIASLRYTFKAEGTYYIGVSGVGNKNYDPINGTGDSPGAEGKYRLSSKELRKDTNDTFNESTRLPINGIRISTINQSNIVDRGDVDVYRVPINRPEKIEFEISPVGTSEREVDRAVRGIMNLYDANGRRLKSVRANSSKIGKLTYNLPKQGDYFIAISGFGNSGYNPSNGSRDKVGMQGQYKLSANMIETDRDDQLVEAKSIGFNNEIASGLTRGTEFSDAADVNMYRFKTNRNQDVTITMRAKYRYFTNSLRPMVTLFNKNGVKLKQVAGTSGISSLTFNSLGGGEYFVAVSDTANQNFSATTGDGDVFSRYGEYYLLVN